MPKARRRRVAPTDDWQQLEVLTRIVVAVVAITLAIFLPWLLNNDIAIRRDALRFTLPAWTFTRQEVLAGRFPAWDPTRLSGTPHAANLQTGFFYPLNWPLLPLDPEMAIRVSVVGHVALGGILLALFARSLRLSCAASTLAGMAYVAGAFVSARTYAAHVQILQTVAWTPLVLLAAMNLALEGRTRWAAGLAVAASLSLVAGYPVFGVYGLMAAGLLFLGSLWRGVRRRQAILLGILAMVLASLAAAPALWSFLELTSHTTRSAPLPAAVMSKGSMQVEYVPMLIWPWFFGATPLDSFLYEPESWWFWHETQVTAGFVLTSLAVFGTLRRLRVLPVQMLALLAVVSLLLAFGPATPLYTGLTQLVPLLQSARIPGRLLVIWMLAVPVLAAVGFDELSLQRSPHTRWLFRIAALVGVIAMAAQIGVLLVTRLASQAGFTDKTTLERLVEASEAGLLNVVLGIAGLLTLWALWSKYPNGQLVRRLFVAGAYLAILSELAVIALPGIYPGAYRGDYSTPESLGEVVERLGARNLEVLAASTSRVAMDMPYAGYSNLGSVLGFRSVSANDPVLLSRTTDLLRGSQDIIIDPSGWGRGGNTIFLPRDGGAAFDVLGAGYRLEHGPVEARLRKRTTQLPRLSLIAESRFAPTPQASVAAVLAPGFRPRSVVILEEAPATIYSRAPVRGEERIEIVAERPGYIRAEVESPSGGYLLFSESYYPGWRAEVGGRTVPLVPADHAVMAARLSPGSHTLTLRFTTPWLMPSLALAGLGVLGIATLFAWREVTTYRRPSEAQ